MPRLCRTGRALTLEPRPQSSDNRVVRRSIRDNGMFREVSRLPFVKQQRLNFFPQDSVALARLIQKSAALCRITFKRGMVNGLDLLPPLSLHGPILKDDDQGSKSDLF